MLNLVKRRSVDLLVEQFWRQGYLTLSRKFGTYLPEPDKIGSFDVDIVARHKNNYAIGITLTADDLNDPNILNKISFLASRHTRATNKRVLLFLGVTEDLYKNAKALLEDLDEETKKNVRVVSITGKFGLVRKKKQQQKPLFS